MSATRGGFALALALGAAACGSKPASSAPSLPPRPPGCDVAVFHDAPDVATENIGPVSASCDESVPDQECLRQLEDEVCKLGGHVVWGVDETPKVEGGKKRLFGRAARRK